MKEREIYRGRERREGRGGEVSSVRGREIYTCICGVGKEVLKKINQGDVSSIYTQTAYD